MVLLPALLISGCAGSAPDTSRLKRFTDIIRGYDDTLTEAEKDAAISELQKDKERQDQQTGRAKAPPKTN